MLALSLIPAHATIEAPLFWAHTSLEQEIQDDVYVKGQAKIRTDLMVNRYINFQPSADFIFKNEVIDYLLGFKSSHTFTDGSSEYRPYTGVKLHTGPVSLATKFEYRFRDGQPTFRLREKVSGSILMRDSGEHTDTLTISDEVMVVHGHLDENRLEVKWTQSDYGLGSVALGGLWRTYHSDDHWYHTPVLTLGAEL
jgi:hypothetical protein